MSHTKKRILVVDDEPMIKNLLYEVLQRNDYEVEIAESGTVALKKFRASEFDLVISDIHIPDVNGMDVLKTIKEINKDVGVILITAFGTIESAVEAMKLGAYDYITKPFSMNALLMLVNKYFDYKKLVDENYYLRNELNKAHSFDNIIGKSDKMLKVFETVDAVADSKATILIQGPSGTGKELVARAIHQMSSRRNTPFIKTNCAALPESLAESELFGHEKGAFTGAIKETKGRFERADGGTILLDEISEMGLALQAKLLRVIQEKEFQKVGSSRNVYVDVRIIATTNRNLLEAVEHGLFREDLYYRLNVVPIILPPLKSRKEDVPLLAEHFILKYANENRKNVKGFDDDVMELFMQYDWPGNVRELENMVERAVVISKEQILTPKHFLFMTNEPGDNDSNVHVVPETEVSLRESEMQLILRVLDECGGNKTHAARKLGISVRTIRNKLKKFALENNGLN
ncbi:sigma-54-dependent Fis family transcriptional regulator [candidate division KSB1 bacterium]|nr:sigma-54-dependent Fis family transcriptional regulator [candidate division KSB1 bacterium]